jgi:hypothetical protein
MKKPLIVSSCAVLLVACAAVPAITKTVADEVLCIENEVLKGDDTFEGVFLACATSGQTVADVETIIGSLMASKTSPAATLAAKVHHVAPGEQPKPATK